MAKRDKLYTVNKWNRPFFEEERRRKLYLGGGELGGLDIYGYGNIGGVTANQTLNSPLYTKINQGLQDFNAYRNP